MVPFIGRGETACTSHELIGAAVAYIWYKSRSGWTGQSVRLPLWGDIASLAQALTNAANKLLPLDDASTVDDTCGERAMRIAPLYRASAKTILVLSKRKRRPVIFGLLETARLWLGERASVTRDADTTAAVFTARARLSLEARGGLCKEFHGIPVALGAGAVTFIYAELVSILQATQTSCMCQRELTGSPISVHTSCVYDKARALPDPRHGRGHDCVPPFLASQAVVGGPPFETKQRPRVLVQPLLRVRRDVSTTVHDGSHLVLGGRAEPSCHDRTRSSG